MNTRQCFFSLAVAYALFFTSVCYSSDSGSGGQKKSIPYKSATIIDFTTEQDRNETGGNDFINRASSSQMPVADINPSRTSCTAPCGIFFEGTGSMDAGGRSIDTNDLHDNDIIDYSWDFGNGSESDVSSGGRYFNGFNGGHVYETPGTYTVTLTVTEKNGAKHSAETEVEISEFTGETYCFSSTGDFTDCPSGGIQITTDSWSGIPGDNNDILDYVAPNRQLFLKRGDTFTFQTPSDIGEGPLHISSFGTGDKPKVQYIGGEQQGIGPIYSSGDNVSVSNIDFGLRNGDNKIDARAGGTSLNLLLLRVDFDNILTFKKFMFVVDSTLKNVDGNPSYAHSEKFVVLNNDFGPSLSHSVYGGHQDKAIFSGNYFHDVSNSYRTGLRLAANDGSSKNILVTNNKFYNFTAYAIQFTVTTNVTERHLVKNVLIKNNYFENCAGIYVTRDHGFSDITIQNNIFKLKTTAQTVESAIIVATDTVGYTQEWAKGVEGLWVFNNVIHNDSNYHSILIEHEDIIDFRFYNNIVYGKAEYAWNRGVYIKYQNSVNELFFDNNLYYYTNNNDNLFYIKDTDTQYNLAGWQGLGFGTNSIVEDPQFNVSDPVAPEDFKTPDSSPAKDNGRIVPLSIDYTGDIRPQGNAFDIGVFEYPRGITLGDVLMVLQICAGFQVDISGSPVTDIDGDDRIGIREAIHALQIVAGL
ncbi:PKD domain-containing protein [Desulfobacterales bacterium HSG17]|nr:PKD domain-containing protein [Desulfobacterales bacterium HSG17]